jgi:HD-GYP domain-containing protein (c-di-GMP phosphodiesterase class II)
MLPIMDAIAGMRLLLAGDDTERVNVLRGALALAGALPVACSGDPAEVAAAVAGDPPAAVLAVAADPAALRSRLDPLALGAGPEVVAIEELTDSGWDAAATRRLGVLVDRRRLRARQGELEATLADHALGRRRELEAAALDSLRRLAKAAEYRDDNTPEHTQRVGDLAARLARELGRDDRTVWLVRHAAPLHDVGKIAVPDSVLLKPSRLTEEEFEVVKTHAVLGARVLAGGASDLLICAEQVARSHHERWDGTGYPDGLSGSAIPLPARIIAVCEAYDTLTNPLDSAEPLSPQAAVDELSRRTGTELDPGVVEPFRDLVSDLSTAPTF